VECTTYLTQDTLDVNFSHTRDANCRFNWNLGEDVREGRYFIDMIITPGTPDHNRGAGAWAFDTNWDFVTMAAKTSTLLYDANSSRNPGAINDTNNPILVVSGSSSSTSQCVTISLDANDSSNISKYWQTITTDSVGQYTDQNVTASYQACVGSSTQLPVTYTYYFKATDFGDRNSSVQSHSITFNSAGGGPASTTTDTGTGDTGGTGGTGGTGSTGGETTPGTETVLEKTVTGTATAEEIAGILAEAGYSEAQIAKMTQTAGNANITQAIKVEKITSSTGAISYKTTVTMTVKNKTGNDWENITVVVEVPKAIATDASEISSTYTMNVLKADPIIEFVVPEVKAGQSADITYSVGKEVGDSAAAEMSAPILTGYTEKAEPEPGPAPTPTPTPTPAPTPEAAGIDLTTIGILVVILVVIVAVYMGVVRKPKKKGLAAVKK